MAVDSVAELIYVSEVNDSKLHFMDPYTKTEVVALANGPNPGPIPVQPHRDQSSQVDRAGSNLCRANRGAPAH